MFIIIEGEFSDWEIKGYVETEEEAQSICAEYNDRNRRFWGGPSNEHYCSHDWWYKEAEPFNLLRYNIKNIDAPTYDLVDVVFDNKDELSYWEMLERFVKIAERPKVIQEDKYCTVIRLRVDPKTSEEKIVKIAKDYLMQYKAEKAGIC